MKIEDIEKASRLFEKREGLTKNIDKLKNIIEDGRDMSVNVTKYPGGSGHRVEVDYRSVKFSKQVSVLMLHEMESELSIVESEIKGL